jgi:hypothetical protein
MVEITIEKLRELCSDIDNIEVTQHIQLKLRQRNIALGDVFNSIKYGKIIENYPDDYPFPSCLILGSSEKDEHIHAVCGVGNNKIWLITAYLPSLKEWEDDYSTRRKVK